MTALYRAESSNRPDIFQAGWPVPLYEEFYEAAHKSEEKALALLSKIGEHSFFSRTLINSIIVPVCVDEFSKVTRENLLGRSPDSEEIFVKTPDNFTLNGILIPGWHSPHKAIIFCNPNGTPMEKMGPVFLRIAYEAGCTGVIFNPRGVDKSEGAISPNGLILDAFTMFEYLVHERKMKPDDIVIYGRSMGGGWGAEAAALIQKHYQNAKINFISERSFRSLLSEAASIVSQNIPVLSQAAYGVAYCFFSPSQLVFNAKNAVQTLRGRVLIIYHKHDGVIPYHRASLNNVIKKRDCVSSGISRLELKDDDLTRPSDHYHLRDFTEDEYRAIKDEVKDILQIEFNF